MKKAIKVLPVLALVLGISTMTVMADDPISVSYRCSVGAYVNVLEEQITNWNETVGKEAGVFIDFQSDINEYDQNMNAFLQSGNYFDIFDVGTDNPSWIAAGYVQDLAAIDDPELEALIDSYAEYMHEGTNYSQGILVGLPLEVLPIKLAVNRDLFEKNGLEYPKTWDDVVHCAQVITENGGGEEFGFGWTNWSLAFRRLAMKETMSSTGIGWFNNNTEEYDFSPFKPVVDALTTMYQNGWMMGADDLAIDPIRAQFSAGKVGMFPAPAYDVSVYTNQFPAECNWDIIDPPVYDENNVYKGVYLERVNCSISKQCWEAADDAKKAAILKAFLFINSDEMNAEIYANGGMIPFKQEIMENTELKVDIPQWEQMIDIANYAPINLFPDDLLPLEGDDYETVFSAIMHGDEEWSDELIQDLNDRYNAAYQELKDEGEIDMGTYAYEYSLALD